jgi:hypothetical protein
MLALSRSFKRREVSCHQPHLVVAIFQASRSLCHVRAADPCGPSATCRDLASVAKLLPQGLPRASAWTARRDPISVAKLLSPGGERHVAIFQRREASATLRASEASATGTSRDLFSVAKLLPPRARAGSAARRRDPFKRREDPATRAPRGAVPVAIFQASRSSCHPRRLCFRE